MCGRKYDSEEAAYEREVYLGARNWHARWRRMEKERLKFLIDEHRSFDIRPTNTHAVVLNREGEPDAEAMTWGFQPGWAKRILINSRGDSLEKRIREASGRTQYAAPSRLKSQGALTSHLRQM